MFWNHSKQHSSKTEETHLSILRQFWNHSKQHSSKTSIFVLSAGFGFGTIRNNTALKRRNGIKHFVWPFWNHSKQHSSKTP